MVLTRSSNDRDGAEVADDGVNPEVAGEQSGLGVTAGSAGAVGNAQSLPPQAVAVDTASVLLQVTNLVAALTQQMSAVQNSSHSSCPPRLGSGVVIPTYSGYSDRKSVSDFLLELETYQKASGAPDDAVLRQVLPVALVGAAARWWRLQKPFSSMAEFRKRFGEEFFPPDYAMRVREELVRRTQGAEESLIEFVRAIQELYSRADPGASEEDKVSRVIRQSHPIFRPYLRGRVFESLDALAREARVIQADLLSELQYRPPPRPEESVEPGCAWAGVCSPVPRGREVESMVVDAERRPGSANDFALPRALDPFSFEQRRRAELLVSADNGPRREGNHTQPPRSGGSRGRREAAGATRGGERFLPRCYGCNGLGHYKRECPHRQRGSRTVQGNQ